MTLLEIEDLVVTYGSGAGLVTAVNGFSASVTAGEVVGVVGESGSGKSALARSIMGLVPPPMDPLATGRIDRGSIRFDGHEIVGNESVMRRLRGRHMGLILQDPAEALDPSMRIGRQITEQLRQHLDLSEVDAERRACELLDSVQIPQARARLRDYPYQFSGGMKQRVVIACALSCGPSLVIADEPTTGLDVVVQERILQLLADLRREHGLAMILISHDLSVIARYTDRTIVMYGGRNVEEGTTASVVARPSHPYTQALLRAAPNLSGKRQSNLEEIPGEPPAGQALAGCPFAPRCQLVMPECRTVFPAMVPAGQNHRVACWAVADGGH